MSVCLSVTPLFCRNGSENQTFSPSGSHIILVFLLYQTLRQYSDRHPSLLNGGVECTGYMKKSRFSTNISLAYISEMILDTAIVTYECEEEHRTQTFEWYHFQ